MVRDDAALVAQARNGNAEAFATLLRRHEARLLITLRAAVSDSGAVADLAQDAALLAWLQLDRLREPERFGAWLAGIGRNLALRHLRAQAARAPRLTVDGALPETTALGEDPSARLLARERTTELGAAIAALPPGQRDVVLLSQLPHDEIGRRLGIKVGAVRTRLHKARTALRARLGPPLNRAPEDPMTQLAVPARITDVRRTPAGRHVVLLAADGHELPIWIGAHEAEAIAAALHDVELPRPHTHALALALTRACGRVPHRVHITRLDAAIFYAEIELDDGTVVDARPSDALVISLSAPVPIEIDPAVLAATRDAPPEPYAADLAGAPVDGATLLAQEVQADVDARAAELERLQRHH